MSIRMYIPNPINDAEKEIYVPVLTMPAYEEAGISEVAKQVGAERVWFFENGIYIRASDLPELEEEIEHVLKHLDPSGGRKEHVEERFRKLVVELRRVFEARPDALAYIG